MFPAEIHNISATAFTGERALEGRLYQGHPESERSELQYWYGYESGTANHRIDHQHE